MKLSTKIFTILGVAGLVYGIGAFSVLGLTLVSTSSSQPSYGYGYGYGSTTSTVVACVPAKLNDVKSSKFATQITALVSKCIVRGNNVAYFPRARVTASEFSKIVLKSFGLASNYTDSFQKAKTLKIVPATMKPSTQLTKTQAYTILKNAFSVAKKKSLTKIPSISRGYITREESAQLVVNAIGAKNIPAATSKE